MPGSSTIKFINSLKQKKYRRQHNLFIVEGEKMVDELLASSFETKAVYATALWLDEKGITPSGPEKPVPGTSEPGTSGPGKSIPRSSGPGKKNSVGSDPEESVPANMALKGAGDGGACPRGSGRSDEGRLPSPVYQIGEKELARVSSLTTPNKVLAIARIPEYEPDLAAMRYSLTLVLDRVQDPGNLGTLVRSADWFGIDTLILSEDSAEITNPKVVQSTMGSIFRVRYHYAHLPSLLASPEFLDLPVYGAFAGAEPVWSHPLSPAGMIILGNESQGITPEVRRLITHRIGIPAARPRSGPESLNIAVAGSIILAEFRRRNC